VLTLAARIRQKSSLAILTMYFHQTSSFRLTEMEMLLLLPIDLKWELGYEPAFRL
jgi:hypothetical protein